MVDCVNDGDVGPVLEMEGKGNGRRGCRGRAPPFFDELLVLDVVDEALSVADE